MNYQDIRTHLNRSQQGMAILLGLNGEHATAKVHEFEIGKREPTGPVKSLYNMWTLLILTDGFNELLLASLTIATRRGDFCQEDFHEALKNLCNGNENVEQVLTEVVK